MADIRSLLRSELASRRPSNPPNTTVRPSKKRKLEPDDSEIRKKSKSLKSAPDGFLDDETNKNVNSDEAGAFPDGKGVPEGVFPAPAADAAEVELESPTIDAGVQQGPFTASEPAPAPTATDAIDEDEWAAFEREVASPTHNEPSALPTNNAHATIEAAPISAADLAEEAKQQRHKTREEELEGEKEDAARHLEEEFDEMEELEDRLRRLKQKREELRRKKGQGGVDAGPVPSVSSGGIPGTIAPPSDDEAEDDDEDDEDEEDWDDWKFG